MIKKAQESEYSEDYQRISSLIHDVKTIIQENIQNKTRADIEAVIHKLENNLRLTDSDINYIRLWIIGDAINYKRMENNFDDWLSELKRLEEVITSYAENGNLEMGDYYKLQGIMEDSARLIPNIINYLEKKERINNFEQYFRDNYEQNRKIIIDILETKLNAGLGQ